MFKTLLLFFLTFFSMGNGWAADSKAPPSFTPADRVLIVAPHPDDEVLGLGGVLQQAKAAGAEVRILYLTNGESNEVSSIFYQKRPLLLRSDFVKNGIRRKAEAMDSMKLLGFSADQLIFFGYPDGGMLNIWLKYWGITKPYWSVFTRIRSVPYKDNFSYGNAYRGDEIIHDFERVFLTYSPTQVFVTAPFDLHQDHQAAYLFTKVTLKNLREQLKPEPKVSLYVIHAHQWPMPKKYLPNTPLELPQHIDWGGGVVWTKSPLTPEQTERKKEAILKYKTQIAYKKNFLLSFARSNEVFADYPHELIRHDASEAPEPFLDAPSPGNVRYRIHAEDLWVEVPIMNALDEMGVLSVYIFSYRNGFLFSDMPKFSFKLFGNKLFAYEGFKNFHDPSIIYRFDKKRMILRIPLKLLKNPDALFVSVRNAKEELSLDFGAWRLLELEVVQ